MRRSMTALLPAALITLGAASANAQELSEICPNAKDGTGAIWGLVSDPDAGMGLPGARVVASWSEDGKTQSAETETQLDGSYTLCYVPLGVDLSVRPMFATVGGAEIAMHLEEIFTRQDISFSMTGARSAGGGEEDSRIWMCIAGGQSTININNTRLIRCESYWKPLEQCPKEELGSVTASPVGDGSGVMREMLERLVQEARRLGANALINVKSSRSAIIADAVRIEVDPSTC